jgi:fumarate reductase flavoprotein subunit
VAWWKSCPGGVHGANRLGGNGVANSTVFGAVAGDTMAAYVSGEGFREPDRAAIDAAIGRCERPFGAAAGGNLNDVREALYDLMWNKVGILRSAADLQAARDGLARLASDLRAHGIRDGLRAFNLTWHDWLNLDSLLEVSGAITAAALAREDSRGAHFREDFPETGPLERSTYTSATRAGAELVIAMKPVAFTRVRPGETLL